MIIRPRPNARLIQLDDLDSEKAAKMDPYSFLTFETSPGNFQAWLSLDSPVTLDLARRLKRGAGADISASGATRIAGSFNFKAKYAPDFPIIQITHVAAGRETTPAALDSAGLLAEPEQPPAVSLLKTRRHDRPSRRFRIWVCPRRADSSRGMPPPAKSCGRRRRRNRPG